MNLPFPAEEVVKLGITRKEIANRAGYRSVSQLIRAFRRPEEIEARTLRLFEQATIAEVRERVTEILQNPSRSLKTRLDRHGIRQQDVADLCDLHVSSVSKILKGQGDFHPGTEAEVVAAAESLLEERHEEILDLNEILHQEEKAGPALPRVEPKVEAELRILASRPEVPSILKDPHLVRGTRVPRADIDEGLRHGVIWHPSVPGTGQLFLMIPVEEIETEGLAAVALLYPQRRSRNGSPENPDV